MFQNVLQKHYIYLQMRRRLFRQQVPVYYKGIRVLVKNVTKYTTCTDVVHMLMIKLDIPADRISSFALFEVTVDLEKMLQGRTRVMKTMRSWGCERDNFSFVLREIECDKACLHKVDSDVAFENVSSSVNGNDNVNNKFLNSPLQPQINRNVLVNDQTMVKYALKKCLKDNRQQTNLNTSNKIDNRKHAMKRTHHVKNDTPTVKCETSTGVREKSELKKQKKSNRKTGLFQKCFHDLISLRKPKQLFKRSDRREPGDGADSEEEYRMSNIRFIDGADISAETQFRTLEERCRYFWNTNSESDDESDCDEELTYFSDLNHAFVKPVREDVSDEGIEVISVDSNDLNTAFIDETKESRDYASRLFEFIDDSDVSISDISSCEWEQNVSSRDVVRDLFCGQKPGCSFVQDEEMDSFMRTRIMDSESDEGLSSSEDF